MSPALPLPALVQCPLLRFFFYEMARYKKLRYRRLRKSNYMVQRRLVQAGSWVQSAVDPQNWLTSAEVFRCADDDQRAGGGAGVMTVSHITVDIVRRPYFKFQSGVNTHYNYVYPGVIWAIVYVPQGTQPNRMLSQTNTSNMILYEPNQFVLGAGVIPDGGFDYVNESVAGEEATFDARPNAGNVTRLRCPLSKKLNPGDSIYLVCSTVNMAYDSSPVGGSPAMQMLVKYALKYN